MGKRGPKKGNGGRPKKIKIDDNVLRQVGAMSGLGLTIEEIGLILNISRATLDRYKAADSKLMSSYKKGKADGKMIATNSLRMLIKAGVPSAVFFYLKTQCGWKEVDRQEITGKDGKAIEIKTESEDNLAALSDDELDQFIALKKKLDAK